MGKKEGRRWSAFELVVADEVAVVVAVVGVDDPEVAAVGFELTGRVTWSVGIVAAEPVGDEPSEMLVVATGAVTVLS